MSRIHEALRRAEGKEILTEAEWQAAAPAGGEVGTREPNEHSQTADVLNVTSHSPLLPISGLADSAHSWKIDPQTVLSFDAPHRDRAAEQFRSLRSRLYQLRDGQRLTSIVITSALPREGKSFVAVNLAQVLALHGERRVLLVDADLRNPRLHAVLGSSRSPGLSDRLLEETNNHEVLQRGSADNLFFVPAGRDVPGPTELLSNGRLHALLTQFEAYFDWIIIDSPCASEFSDACSLADCSDGVLMVVRANSTPCDIVRKSLDRFTERVLLGVVLNEIVGKNGHLPPRDARRA
jgi:protein-tyrosine kinase